MADACYQRCPVMPDGLESRIGSEAVQACPGPVFEIGLGRYVCMCAAATAGSQPESMPSSEPDESAQAINGTLGGEQ